MAPRVSGHCPCCRCRGVSVTRLSDRGALASFSLAASLASLAGATDVYGVGLLQDLFVSFMSGNTTLLGVALGQGDRVRFRLIVGLIATFVAGATAGAALSELTGRRHAAAVTIAVASVLAIPLLWPVWAVPSLVVAMGALNASMNHVGQASISLTYVTGTLVKFGQGIGRTVCGKRDDWSWMWQAPMWGSLLTGAVAATVLRKHLGPAFWPLPAYALAIGVAVLLQDRRTSQRDAVRAARQPVKD